MTKQVGRKRQKRTEAKVMVFFLFKNLTTLSMEIIVSGSMAGLIFDPGYGNDFESNQIASPDPPYDGSIFWFLRMFKHFLFDRCRARN